MSSGVPDRPLRIVQLGKFYPPAAGGIETHVQALAEGQARLGADVSVVCINHADAAGTDVTHESFRRTPTVREEVNGIRVTRLGRWASLARLEISPAVLPELLLTRADVLHLHAPNPALTLALVAMPRLPPLVITHHSDIVRQRFLGKMFGPVERLLYARASLILSDSEPYIAGSPILSRFVDKVRALPLGIDLTPFLRPNESARRAAAEWKRRYPSPLWLTVGRLVYYKGLKTALDALTRVPGHLLIVGTGPEETVLRARVAELELGTRVTFAGYLTPDQLVGAYLTATALWFPSNARSEGFGLSQVEAMASGCPVINTQIANSGVPWVSQDGESGLTVPMRDAQALAESAKRLATDASLRRRLSEGAVKRARSEFDQMKMCSRSLSMYSSILGRAVLAMDEGRGAPVSGSIARAST